MNVNDLLQPELAQLLRLGCAQLQSDYRGVNARLYDFIQGGTRDIEYCLRTIGPAPATVLELGSGTGRLAIPLAEAGHKVYALDSSPDMHRMLLEKTPESLRHRLVPVESDMCSFSLGVLFDIVILGLNTVFSLVDDQDRRACFDSVRGHLKPNGRFMLDFSVPSVSMVSNKSGKYSLSVHEESARRASVVLTYNRYDIKRQLSILNFLTMEIVDGRIARAYVTPAAEYYPSPGEMRLLVENAGMRVTETFGDYDGRPFLDTGEGRDVIMIAELAGGG